MGAAAGAGAGQAGLETGGGCGRDAVEAPEPVTFRSGPDDEAPAPDDEALAPVAACNIASARVTLGTIVFGFNTGHLLRTSLCGLSWRHNVPKIAFLKMSMSRLTAAGLPLAKKWRRPSRRPHFLSCRNSRSP